MRKLFLLGFLLILGCSPSEPEEQKEQKQQPAPEKDLLFTLLDPSSTGMSFENNLTNTDDFDVFRYRNFYNGGGVGIGDVNNDGLSDVYLTSNMGDNKLFLNKGGWKFEDITERAGVKGTRVWSTGVSMVDINADGFLDIYVSNSGDIKGDRRENELFINNGDLTFTERAAEYGLDDKGFSTHAAFFDYDRDGDLDCYVLNNSFRPIGTLGYRNLRDKRDPDGGDKLYENVNGKFRDVSEASGIFGSVIGFGLGITVGDVSGDGWPDMYVSNDFYERDYLYINNKNGTFSEKLEEYLDHISMFSMGADIADLNNDGYPEIFSTDMLPHDNYRLKTMANFETYDVYRLRIRNGYYHQFMRNMLQLNNQDGTFSEVGELAGVSATDWSWGALIADFNNDSFKEIFISNGIYKDVTNQDFVDFFGSNEQIRAAMEGKKINWKLFTEKMPSQKLSNFLFTHSGDLKFTDVSAEWGLDEPGFSNGAAYGDLDNDGDLDLIVNNVNQELFVYRNQTQEKKPQHYLAVSFLGEGLNTFGVGATVSAVAGTELVAIDHMPIRGFQSSMDYKMLLGLGRSKKVDSLTVVWPDGSSQLIRDVAADQHIVLKQSEAKASKERPARRSALLDEVPTNIPVHRENEFNDFDRDRLLYHMHSTLGPAFAKADLNGDGLDDFYMGGATGTAGAVYIQETQGRFIPVAGDVFAQDSLSEDVAAVFFDSDGDRDLDLYVVSGGSEATSRSPAINDRLYENKGLVNGIPRFEKTSGRIPDLFQSGSCVKPADIDNDGDLDLFLGTRLIPSYYGLPADQFILLNDGTGRFEDKTTVIAPALRKLGMVTDAAWFDYDGDGFQDLLIAGEWMPLQVFRNTRKGLEPAPNISGLKDTQGWWNRIHAEDIDKDGDIDFILGNSGMNNKFRARKEAPLKLYVNDFDQNGSLEPIIAYPEGGQEFPMVLRQDLIKQMSSLKRKFVYYKDYADKSMDEVFEKRLLEKATVLLVKEMRTGLLVNEKGNFTFVPLSDEAQFSPVYAIETADLNRDGFTDIILGGNLFEVKPEAGRYDALHGLVLAGDGKNNFTSLKPKQSGLSIKGQVRHISRLRHGKRNSLLFIRNDEPVRLYSF